MAWHVRGVVLPDDDVRDLWLVGDRVTLEPVPGAVTLADRGYLLPGLVDAHCHVGIRPGGGPIESVAEARELATIDRDRGVLAIRDAGSPYPYPELDDAADLPRLARAGRHVAPVRRYLRDIGVEVEAPDLPAAVKEQAAAGNGWVKLVGDWIDRGTGDLAPAWDVAAMADAVAVAHAAGARVAAHMFGEESVAALVRAGVDSVEHGTGLSEEDIEEMAARGTALVPTMINVARFEEIAARRSRSFPGTPTTCGGCGTASRRWWRRPTTPAFRSTSVPTRAAASGTARRRRRCCCCASGPDYPQWTFCGPVRGARGSGWASPAWSRAAWPIWWSTTRTPGSTSALCSRPG